MTEPWQWSEQTWRGHVGRVRAGRPLRPESWPGGARVAVALSFDSDHETISLRDGHVLPGKLSQGEYGSRVGVPRVVKLLERFGAPSTFFMPAVSALLHDGEAQSYVDAGHEVALHGWIHESNAQLPPAAERDLTFRAADTLERLTGTRPVGIRTPSWDFSESSLAIIRELGLAYDSSLMADNDCYEILAGGEPTGIVELPVEWIRDDAPYFTMNRFGSQRPYTPPREVLPIWRDEFDLALAEGGLFQLTMHPHIIGHRSRITILAELLEHIASHDGVWFATHAQVVDYVSAPMDDSHDDADGRG
ncbi:polysaccharide deacetylase family protein [Amycolatopsis nivea]